MTDPEDLSYISALGVPFLSYVLNRPDEAIRARIEGTSQHLGDPYEEAFVALLGLARELASDTPLGENVEPGASMFERMRRFAWFNLDHQASYANIFRVGTGGDFPHMCDDRDPLEAALVAAAVDFFPVTLIPADRETPVYPRPTIARVRVEAVAAAAVTDPLRGLFVTGTTFYTSAGAGYGPLWPFRLAELPLATAEARMRMLRSRDPSSYVFEVIANLRLMRQLYLDGAAEVPAALGIWNILLPYGRLLRGPRNGTIRPATESDPHVPMASRATAVLDTSCTVHFAASRLPPDDEDYYEGVKQLAAEGTFVSVAGLLTTAGSDDRAMPQLAWTKIFDPFQPYVGWFTYAPSFPRTRGIAPDELAEFERWLERIDDHYDPSVRVAFARTISGFADRPHDDDTLIDIVIGLENLFGGRGSNLRDRIANGLALLTGTTPEERTNIVKEARMIYDARSDLVHGEELRGRESHPSATAERLLLEALRVLFTTRTDLIPDRRARSQLGRTR